MEDLSDQSITAWLDEDDEAPPLPPPPTLWEQIRKSFQPANLIASLMAGSITGIIGITTAIAFASLLFSGELAPFASRGIGFLLFGGMIIATITSLLSSGEGVIAGVQDTAIAVLSVVSVVLVESVPPGTSPDDLFITMVGTVIASTILTGLAFLTLGFLKLGNLIRFIPYPVIGGFLSGSGLLLVRGALGMMTGASLGEALTQPPLIAKWLPGLAFAVIMIIILRRNSHFLVVPSLILGGVGIFFLTLLVSGTPLSAASAGGWMVSAGPGGTLWNPVSIAALRGANWGFVFSHVGSLLSVTVVVLLSLLLNASAIELETKQEIDLNRELKVLGLANVLAGLGASPAGGPYLGSTTLVKRMGASTRLVGVAQAMVAGIILFAGASLLGYIPKFVLGGLVLYFGLSFLLRWVWDSRAELPTADYVVILMILGVIFVFGFIPGVAVGIVLAVVLFVVNYSRINVIKHQLSGVNHQSTVERPTLYRDLLRRKGHWLYMLKLQGFIFFGTANTLFNQFRARIEAPDRQKPRFFLLDFRLVTGVDSSAMLSFRKMLQLAETHHILLIFTSLSEVMEARLSHAPFAALKGVRWMSFPDLDYGMEWYEDQVIKNFESVGFGVKPPTMTRQLQKLLPDREAVRKMMGYFIEMKVESGTTLVDQGEAPKGIWFIEEGQVTVELVVHDERTIRLRTLNSGTAIGELGVYMNIPTTAKVIAVRPASLFFLSTESLGDMEKNAPELAAAFHRFMAHTIAERLVTAGETMKVLLS